MTSAYYVHSRLRLIHGLPAISGDTNTNESVKKTVDLLSAGGFNLATDVGAWVPRLGALAGGGNYLQLGGAQGEVLQESNYERVTETFTLTVNAGNPLDRLRLENDLLYMKHNAEAFWAQEGNLDPVYLEWGVVGQTGIASAPIYQYAHVYSLDFAWSNSVPQTVTLTVVRRPDWWPIPPGANPQYWTKYAESVTPTTSNMSVATTGSDIHLVYSNSVHFQTTTSPAYVSYIDIPASQVPGSLPALTTFMVSLVAQGGGTNAAPNTVVIGRYTKPTTFNNGGTAFSPLATLPCSIMTMGTDATSVADTTAVGGNALNISFATATLQLRASISATNITAGSINQTLVPGKYLIFARVKPQAITSTFQVQLALRVAGATLPFSTGELMNVPAMTVNDFDWNVINMGEFTVPGEIAALDGTGLDPTATEVLIYASRSGGASALRISDLMFIPTDEAAVLMKSRDPLAVFSGTRNSLIIDNTGYLKRAQPDDYAIRQTGGTGNEPLEFTGTTITLRPRVNNRLYIFAYQNAESGTPVSTRTYVTYTPSSARLEVGVNIIPRWLGLRDT